MSNTKKGKGKPKPLTVILNSINKKTELLDEKYIYANYNPYIINRIFCTFSDTLPFSEFLNSYSDLDIYLQYKFYFYGVPKKYNRFNRWVREENSIKYKSLSWFYKYMGDEDIRDAIKTNSNKIDEIVKLYEHNFKE